MAGVDSSSSSSSSSPLHSGCVPLWIGMQGYVEVRPRRTASNRSERCLVPCLSCVLACLYNAALSGDNRCVLLPRDAVLDVMCRK
jgi:hypothetical protein